MPLYVYTCPICGEFEVLQKLNEEPKSICDVCGGPVKKIMSAPGMFVFNGKGFYNTDYKKKHEEPGE